MNGNLRASYQTIQSPLMDKLTKSARKMQNPEKVKELQTILAGTNSTDVFTNERFPRPKPFFYQAYLGKSKLDTLSQTSSKLGRSKSYRKIMKAHYPMNSKKKFQQNSLTKLPTIKNGRFNEEVLSEYSVKSRKSKFGKLRGSKDYSTTGAQQYIPQNLTLNKLAKVDGSHLSQVSDRASELKKVLIDTIEHMDDKEVEVMKSAIDSVRHGSQRSRQVGN